jgi:hypothetical protein
LLERVASEEYRDAAKGIEHTGNTISHKEVGRIVGDVGGQLRSEEYGPEAQISARSNAPGNPPDTLVVLADAGMHRTNEADKRASDDTSGADPTDERSGAEDEPESAFGELSRGQRDRGWRDHKVGVVARVVPGKVADDGMWERAPEEQVKSYVATTGDIKQFGRDLKTEAERRGMEKAKTVIFLSDNGHGIPQMRQREFPEAHFITDFKHTKDRLRQCAEILEGTDDAHKPARVRLFVELKGLLWDGKIDGLVARLSSRASKLAPRPAKPSHLKHKPDAEKVWDHIFYLERWRHTMDYPTYRQHGWPIGSGSVESACGQFGDRIKHARMRWTEAGTDAMLMVKSDIFSQDGRWEDRWPDPIPVLELPEMLDVALAA